MDTLSYRGQVYSVECNFNALCAYADLVGSKDFSCLICELSYGDWLRLMTCCINEGERLMGKAHDYAPDFFGLGNLEESAKALTSFIDIYRRQTGEEAADEKKSD